MKSFKDKLKYNLTLVLIASILIGLLWVSGIYFFQLKPKENHIQTFAQKGEFDYSKIDFTQQNYTQLNGEVEFYWEKFLYPKDFESTNDTLSPQYLEIFSEWNKLVVNGQKIGPMGYGTYHFTIHVNSPGLYAFKINEFESAFHIWINSQDFGGAGKVGKSKKDMQASWQRQEYDFYVADSIVDVVLQVSNFHHRLGGTSEPILFGGSKSLRKFKSIRLSIETFLLGLLTILTLYHLTLYHYRRTDKSILFFSLMSLSILLRLSTTGEKLILNFFPSISWEIAVRIEYISLPLIGMFLTSFLYYMLPKNIPFWFKKTIYIIALSLSAIILFLPSSIFTYTSLLISGLSVIFVFSLFIFLFKAVIQKKENAKGLFGGYFFLFIVMINDILFYLGLINSSFLLPFGLIIFLFIQTFIISRNTSIAYLQVEQLSKKLERHTEKLEDLISERTKALQIQNNEIKLKNNRIEDQADILYQTNHQLIELNKFKNKMTNMMVHDLKNPLGNIIGLLNLSKMTDNTRKLASTSGNDMLNLIQNILDVTKYEETKLKTHNESVLLHDLAEIAYHQNEFVITLNSIKYENLIPEDFQVNVDKNLIIRVFSNIISNATKYQNLNGLIRLSVEQIEEENHSFNKIHIFNTGESIPKDKQDAIFNIYNQIYINHQDHKYSTGIGLTFCKIAVEAHGGKIGVFSEEGVGVDFWFTLPINK